MSILKQKLDKVNIPLSRQLKNFKHTPSNRHSKHTKIASHFVIAQIKAKKLSSIL